MGNPRTFTIVGIVLLALIWVQPVLAQDEDGGLNWLIGPTVCELGRVAQIDVPEGYQFVDGDGTRILMEWFENPTSGSELGLVMPIPTADGSFPWIVVFEYDPLGYVRDDEKDDLDADAILKSISEGTERANEVRRERGWEEFHVLGWQTPPFYDPSTNNLKWAIIGGSDSGESINFSTRILGRGGAMSADLIIAPEELDTYFSDYEALIAGFSFTQGHRYAEFREGDKVAKYGLTALVAGGAGAVAMKSGLLARFWKLIVLGFFAVVGFFRRLFARLFGRSEPAKTYDPPQNPDKIE